MRALKKGRALVCGAEQATEVRHRLLATPAVSHALGDQPSVGIPREHEYGQWMSGCRRAMERRTEEPAYPHNANTVGKNQTSSRTTRQESRLNKSVAQNSIGTSQRRPGAWELRVPAVAA
jgi:hypothetical protein